MRDKQKDAAQMAIKRQRMLEVGFELFSQRGIDAVTMPEVARTCGYGIATLYRYFDTKAALVIAVGTWAWEQYLQAGRADLSNERIESMSAAEIFENYLDLFIDLYCNHKDLLRFNQFFNVYLQGEHASQDQIAPYLEIIQRPRERFHEMYRKATQDGTMRTDVSEEEMFASTLHIMLAVTTRYAVGLVYTPEHWVGAEEELQLVKRLLIREYVVA